MRKGNELSIEYQPAVSVRFLIVSVLKGIRAVIISNKIRFIIRTSNNIIYNLNKLNLKKKQKIF